MPLRTSTSILRLALICSSRSVGDIGDIFLTSDKWMLIHGKGQACFKSSTPLFATYVRISPTSKETVLSLNLNSLSVSHGANSVIYLQENTVKSLKCIKKI